MRRPAHSYLRRPGFRGYGGSSNASVPGLLVAPVISGTILAGNSLTLTPGSWTNTPLTVSWTIRRGGVAIVGQTGLSEAQVEAYVLTTDDEGPVIDVVESVTNLDGSASSTSNRLQWSPLSEPTLLHWLSASSSTMSLTGSSVNSVTCLKSGVVCTGQGSAGQLPQYGATLNGGMYPAFGFVGSTRLSCGFGATLSGITAYTIIYGGITTPNNSNRYIAEYGTNVTSVNNTFAQIDNFTSGDRVSSFHKGTGAVSHWNCNAAAENLRNPKFAIFRWDGSLATNELSPVMTNNADLAGAYVANIDSTTGLANTTLHLGARSSNTQGFDGTWSDYLIFSSVLSAAKLTLCQRYLGGYWSR